MRFFSSRYRAVTYSARGYLPSDVFDSPEDYSQDNQIEDLKGLMDGLKIEKAHLCGLSMGSYTSLLFGIKYPQRCLSLTIAGSGYESGANRGDFHKEIVRVADQMLKGGMKSVSGDYLVALAWVQLQNKNSLPGTNSAGSSRSIPQKVPLIHFWACSGSGLRLSTWGIP